VDNEWLMMKDVLVRKQLETIKKKYQRNGNIYIQSKEEMRAEKPPVPSPDDADTLMMAVWAIRYMLGKMNNAGSDADSKIIRKNERTQRR
jgi:hypothetical protein